MSDATWASGINRTDAGETVASPSMSLDELLRSLIGSRAQVDGKGNYITVTLRPLLVSGIECCVVEKFIGGRLDNLFMGLSLSFSKQLGFGDRWRVPNPEVAWLEDWVQRETGKKSAATFPRGTIRAIYDDRGGFPCIVFRYPPPIV
jgi:hypothetical protein